MKVGGGSYLSSHDPRWCWGWESTKAVDWVEIKWPQPGGGTQKFTGLPVDRYITITEGEEKWR